MAEDTSYSLFESLVKEGRMHTVPTLLPGRLDAALSALLTYSCLKTKAWQWVGHAKYDTFLVFAQLFPEYDFIFCGDNGQGDLMAGQMMLKLQSKGSPGNLSAESEESDE